MRRRGHRPHHTGVLKQSAAGWQGMQAGIMQGTDLHVGRTYAYRQTARRDDLELMKVKILGPSRGRKIRIRFEDGDLTGLDEWVPVVQIVCRWTDRKAFLTDHRRAAELRQATNQTWDAVTEDAICWIMTASGEENGFDGQWVTDSATAQRLWSRALLPGSPLEDHPSNYIDRFGTWHLSFQTAEKAAQGFAAADPDAVNLYITNHEEPLKAQGFQPGNRHAHDVLRSYAPCLALARSWTKTQTNTALEHEVERLRKLTEHAIQLLRSSGNEEAAQQIQRGLRGE